VNADIGPPNDKLGQAVKLDVMTDQHAFSFVKDHPESMLNTKANTPESIKRMHGHHAPLLQMLAYV